MKKTLAKLLSAVLLVFLVIACAKSPVDDAGQLNGQWKWEFTSGGFIGSTTYADSVDYSRSVYISIPAKTIIFYKNKKQVSSYTLRYSSFAGSDGKQWNFKTGESTHSYLKLGEGSKLHIIDNCYDCYIQTFTMY